MTGKTNDPHTLIPYSAHETATIDPFAQIGTGTKIWHYSHLMNDCEVGIDCRIGQNVYIAEKVQIGNRVSIQNNVSVYCGVVIEDDVFVGPNVTFTNVRYPRAFISRKHQYESTILGQGCSIGANTTIRCGLKIGSYAMIGAGSLLLKSVPDYALFAGHPARQVAWVGRRGVPLVITAPPLDRDQLKSSAELGEQYFQCPESSDQFIQKNGYLEPLSNA